MKRVLILCTGNSCRSQMAEVIWNELAGDRWIAFSAGSKPAGYVHPLALQVLQEDGLPVEHLISKSADAFTSQTFDLVVTVCDNAQEACPHWPGAADQQHWPFEDPAYARGSDDEVLQVFRSVKKQIGDRIAEFLANRENDEASLNPLAKRDCAQLIEMALAEDLGDSPGWDCTTQAVIPQGSAGNASFVSRETGVLCGLAVCREVIERFEGRIDFAPHRADGDEIMPMAEVATIQGNARDILKVERTCLNFLCRLSGIATLTRQFVTAIQGTNARVYDTRKTTPGWRRLEKHAVACGGGYNHRMGLWDAILIKDNHLAMLAQESAAIETIADAIHKAREWVAENANRLPFGNKTVIQVEIDRLDQLPSALKASPTIILLDNMSNDELAQAVQVRDQQNPSVQLEASGGVTLGTISTIAQTGVDRISVGALTHSAVNLDIGLDWHANS